MKHSILASLRRVLALTLVCCVVTRLGAQQESTDGLTAQQILEKMATVYATCKSYRDSGVVTNVFSPEHIDIKPFHTAFVRPDQFRFEYDDPTPDKSYIVWAKTAEVRTWWYVEPGVQKARSLEHAIAGATGVSGGSAQTIPALLLPDQIGGSRLTSMTDLTRLADDGIDETACFKLQGKFANEPMTLWIEKTTFLVRRIVEETDLARDTTVYRSEVDKEISTEELEFNAPNMNSRRNNFMFGRGEIILILGFLMFLAICAIAFFGLVYLIVRAITNRPVAPPSTLPPEVLIQNQQKWDREHLKLVSIFHFVVAGLCLFGIAFVFVHYFFMHAMFSNPEMWKGRDNTTPLPPGFFNAFIWIYGFFAAVLVAASVLNLLSGIFLLQRRNRIFSIVVAGLDCLQIPIGTALGVFTIIVLSRETVRGLYSRAWAQ